MEIVELATHLKKSADNLMELKNKAEELSKDFGDVHLFNFNKIGRKFRGFSCDEKNTELGSIAVE